MNDSMDTHESDVKLRQRAEKNASHLATVVIAIVLGSSMLDIVCLVDPESKNALAANPDVKHAICTRHRWHVTI